jgi:hypothetical protein
MSWMIKVLMQNLHPMVELVASSWGPHQREKFERSFAVVLSYHVSIVYCYEPSLKSCLGAHIYNREQVSNYSLHQ